jgi:hypothetical protein
MYVFMYTDLVCFKAFEVVFGEVLVILDRVHCTEFILQSKVTTDYRRKVLTHTTAYINYWLDLYKILN